MQCSCPDRKRGKFPPFSANVVEDGIEIGLISAHLHEGIEHADFRQFLCPVIDDFGVRRRKCPAGVPAPRSPAKPRAPRPRMEKAAISLEDIGFPVTQSSGGPDAECRFVEILSFVHDSSSMMASRSSGPATTSRIPVEG